MVWIIVGILVIVVIGLGVWYWQMHNAQTIKNLDGQVATLDSGEITGLIRKIEQLGLTGDSLKDFTDWQHQYQQVVEKNLADLQTELLDAETQNKNFHFAQARTTIADIKQLIASTAKQVNAIRTALVKLKESEADTRTRLLALRDTYQESRKTVLAKSFAFGDALPALEGGLQDIDSQLKAISKTNSTGDHEAAAAQLDAFADTVGNIQAQVKALPPLVNEVVNEFPAQLNEIEQGYSQLSSQHYNFTEDVPTAVAEVKGQIEKAEEHIKSLNVKDAKTTNAQIADAIDAIYAVMEKELSAKKTVEADSGDLAKFIAHAQHQNEVLRKELDHLNQSYTLTHGEINTANDLHKQLDDIDAAYEQAVSSMDDNTAVYSELLKQFTADRENLKAIEIKQRDINDSVADLRQREDQANAQIHQFERDLRDIKYEVSRHSLPGLPRQYLDFFKVVTREYNDLTHDMDQVKIDMDQIAKQLIKLAADIDKLKDQSRSLIDAAGLTEQLLQYANRYKASKPAVAKAADAAQANYERYDYQAAADGIATALEEVEPGAYKKVEHDYLNSKTESLF